VTHCIRVSPAYTLDVFTLVVDLFYLEIFRKSTIRPSPVVRWIILISGVVKPSPFAKRRRRRYADYNTDSLYSSYLKEEARLSLG